MCISEFILIYYKILEIKLKASLLSIKVMSTQTNRLQHINGVNSKILEFNNVNLLKTFYTQNSTLQEHKHESHKPK